MKTTKESELVYVGECPTHELCCRIVAVDKYGGKQPCGVRAVAYYATKAGGKVYLCAKHKPVRLSEQFGDLAGLFGFSR